LSIECLVDLFADFRKSRLAMSNGWAGTEHLTAQAELNTVLMSAFDAVDVSGILVDPATGWQIHT
jgi:hypothetical protein